MLDDVTWLIGPGDRIGVVGINGSGKSTLLRVLVGERPLTCGSVKRGQTVHIGYLSQEVVELPGDLRLLEAVTRSPARELGGKTSHRRNWPSGSASPTPTSGPGSRSSPAVSAADCSCCAS